VYPAASIGTIILFASFPPKRNMHTSALYPGVPCASALTKPNLLSPLTIEAVTAEQHASRTKSLLV
jgi:hypothetical protein